MDNIDEIDIELLNSEEAFDRELLLEQENDFEIQLEKDENPQVENNDPPQKRKLKRELQAEALARLESAARTVEDFKNIAAWWDRLDANRERRERYHEICRSGDELPLEYGVSDIGRYFPDSLNGVFARQIREGDFLDVIFNCPYEIHELVSEDYLCKTLFDLNENHKELLFYSAVRLYSSAKIARIRGQTDRNIRKVMKTVLKKIHKNILPELKRREEKGLPMTLEERNFLEEIEKHLDIK